MAKRRAKRTAKQPASSTASIIDGGDLKEPLAEKKEDLFRDHEVEQRSTAIRAIRDLEIEQLRTGLRLLRSYFSEEQLQVPVLQFFKENLPNLTVSRNGKDGHYEVHWTNGDGNLSMSQAEGGDLHTSLLFQMSTAYPECSAAMPSFGGLECSSKSVKSSFLAADSLRIKDFVLDEPLDLQILGLRDGLQTPGASSQRLSVGMTPKTLRLPKYGEMLMSVHGSPLGVYKEDNMEAIHESEEG